MKLVSENSDDEIRAKEAAREVEEANREMVEALRELAANILRCAAGHGKDYEIEGQCQAFLEARGRQYELYNGLAPLNAAYHLQASTALKDYRDWVDNPYHADCVIRDAAMQIHAAYLRDQLTHVRRGETKLDQAIKDDGYKRVRPKERM